MYEGLEAMADKSGSDTERTSTHDVRVYPDTSDRYFEVCGKYLGRWRQDGSISP